MSIQDIAESGDPPNAGNDEADNQPTFPGNEDYIIDIPDFQVWCKYLHVSICLRNISKISEPLKRTPTESFISNMV